MFDLTLFFWLLQWVAAYAQKGEDLLLSSLLVLHQQHLWFFRLLITAFIFASSFDAHYYRIWDNAVELITATEEALHYWPGIHDFTFNYVDGCAICQATKNLPNCPSIPLHPIPPLSDATLFSTVSMDFITKLPKSDGFDAITVFIDHDVTKAAVFAPCHSTITADGTATLYHNHVTIPY